MGRQRGDEDAGRDRCGHNLSLFGKLGTPDTSLGSIFAFQVLPTINFHFSFLCRSIPHRRDADHHPRACVGDVEDHAHLQAAESMNVAASIFMGQTEAPLTIRPFLAKATRSELMTVMTSGMAHVSGGIMAMYISQGIEARHLLSAVIMTSPGTILMAKMLVPGETEVPATEGSSCDSRR